MRSKFPGVSWMVDHWHELWRFGLHPGSMPAMTFASICVILATAVRIGLGHIGPDSAAFAPYYAATLVAAHPGSESISCRVYFEGGSSRACNV